ncbi:MAG: hypothetical protein ACTSVO_03590 [Candidatus Heimdallarchaeaceae archaeon]
MSYGIKNGIMKELEEELCDRLERILQIRQVQVEEEDSRKMLLDLLQGADEVLTKWL